MTDAGTTIGEDEEDWQSLDESQDEGLGAEDNEILIDPALLEPQASLVIAFCLKKESHPLSPLRSHEQVYDFQEDSDRSLQEPETIEAE
jgi:hypothetical protein